jgi:hypothetical protein
VVGFPNPVQEHQAAPLGRQADPLLTQLLTLAFPGSLLSLGLGRQPDDGQGLVVAGQEAVQARGQFQGIGPVVVDPTVTLVQPGMGRDGVRSGQGWGQV